MMRRIRAGSAVLAFAAVGACASAPPAPAGPPPFDPVGTFDFSTSVDGQTVTGVITITRGANGVLAGIVATSATPEMPMQSVVADGTRVTLRTSTPDGAVLMTLDFDDPAFSGTWSFGGLAGSLTGRRRQP